VNQPNVLMLAVDQRPWLTQALFGHTGTATPGQRAILCDAKHLVLDGLLSALAAGAPSPDAAILVDDTLGPGVAERARAHGVTLAMPVERAGLDVYEDDPDDLAGFLAHHAPDFAKVLVRYNVEGDDEANAVQLKRLARTARITRDAGCRFLFELLVPATPAQLAAVDGDAGRYARERRPHLIRQAMTEIAAAIEVDIWKLEHLATPEHYGAAVDIASRTGGHCILLGAGAPTEEVDGWLDLAARSGFLGFAIGRSIWGDPVRSVVAGRQRREDAVATIAARYQGFVDAFLSGHGHDRQTTER
jgi:myo-inositol catabolism protein IolC